MAEKRSIGFIGLGNIGKPMAKHLIQDQFDVMVYDVLPEAMQDLVELGATAAESPAAIFTACDHIGLCVRDNNDVESLLYGDIGVLAVARPGTIVAVHSTITQAGLFKWVADAKDTGIVIIDAPITGGAAGAEAGKLCYMVGGDADVLETCRPVFETSADKIVHAGELGTGIALKLCNNLITYAEFTAMSEATALAEACGLSPDVLREVGKSNGVINESMYNFVTGRNGCMRGGFTEQQMDEFFGGFARLGEKDLDCALQTAEPLNVNLPQTEMVRSILMDVFMGRI